MPSVRVTSPKSDFNLKKIDPGRPNSVDKDQLKQETEKLGAQLAELLDLLFAAGQHGLLIVLQGMDTSGKDGTIRGLLRNCNAQSTSVAPFKVPTPEEIAHDFLWRCHAKTPGKGSITIFNRSHYEDVLVVRVHNFVPESVWSKRYDRIRQFEELLAENNTIILKFFLHISKNEQEERLLEREKDVTKAWKLSAGDWKERELWEDYQKAYEVAIDKCASEVAPWIVVPANSKTYRDYLVVKELVETLEPYRAGWLKKLESIGEKAKAELAEYKASASKA